MTATTSESSIASAVCLAAGLLALGSAGSSHAQAVLRADARLPTDAIAEAVRGVPVGGRLILGGVALGAERADVVILERFLVFTPDARIVAHGSDGDVLVPLPRRTYFRGEVSGEPGSTAFVSVGADGRVRGLVETRGGLHLIGSPDEGPRHAPLVSRSLEELLASRASDAFEEEWSCLAGLEALESANAPSGSARAEIVSAAAPAFALSFSAEVAIETDFEFYALFGNVHRAADYVGDLLGAISTLYARDVGTTLKVTHLSLWTTKGSTYPWGSGTSSCVTLAEFGDFWHANRTGVRRDTAHFLSGRAGNNGIAWLGVLCRGDFAATIGCGTTFYETFGGGYGVTHGIDGVFSLSTPSFYWDVFGTAHEIGHNFDSPHTHCYNDIPTAGQPPVDECFSGECKQTNPQGQCVSACYEGPTSVPSGGGSIMSYCQLRPGGLSNVNLTFGEAGSYGTASERVPARMRSFVESRTCLSFIPARAADFNGEGRSDVVLYRGDGDWSFFPLWPGN